MEPAIKVAADHSPEGKILVLATEVTLQQKKYLDLVEALDIHHRVEGIAAPRLVDFAEEFVLDGSDVEAYLQDLLQSVDWSDYSAVVLGCTHFPFFESSIKKIIPDSVQILDGHHGTVQRLASLVEASPPSIAPQLLTLLSGHKVNNEVIQPYLNYLTRQETR